MRAFNSSSSDRSRDLTRALIEVIGAVLEAQGNLDLQVPQFR